MKFKSPLWMPFAWIVALVNVGSIWPAAAAVEPLHATVHGVFGVAFAIWAEHLRRRKATPAVPSVDDLRQEIEDMQLESRDQIMELQERVDFAERLLAQNRMPQEVKPPVPPNDVRS